MSIWNKVLTGLVIATLLAFFYLSARAFATHKAWRTSIDKHQSALAQTSQEREKLIEGDAAGSAGIRQLQVDLQRLTVGRGRVWKNVNHGEPEAATGKVRVSPQQPKPDEVVKVGTQIFAFRQAADKDPGSYLGDFKVTFVSEKEWELQPTRTMLPQAVTRLQQSRGPWVLYEKMPGPHPEFLDDAGQPAAAPPADVKAAVDRYAAQMVNFQKFLDEFYSWHAAMMDTLAALRNNNASLETAIKLSEAEIAKLREDKKTFNDELTEITRRRNAVADHLNAVKAKLAQVEEAANAARKANEAYAAEIARLQLEATRRIDGTQGAPAPAAPY